MVARFCQGKVLRDTVGPYQGERELGKKESEVILRKIAGFTSIMIALNWLHIP